MSTNQRSAKNILVRPRQQMRFAVLLFAGSSALLAVYVIALLTSLISNLGTMARENDLPPDILQVIVKNIETSMIFIGVFGFCMTVGMLAIGVTLSHRIFGPLVPIQALIEKLKAGDYGARGHLRKNDEFKEMMTSLNELAAELQNKHGKNA